MTPQQAEATATYSEAVTQIAHSIDNGLVSNEEIATSCLFVSVLFNVSLTDTGREASDIANVWRVARASHKAGKHDRQFHAMCPVCE